MIGFNRVYNPIMEQNCRVGLLESTERLNCLSLENNFFEFGEYNLEYLIIEKIFKAKEN